MQPSESADRAHELYQEIGKQVVAHAPKFWRLTEIYRRQLGTYATTAVTYTVALGSRRPADLGGLDELFNQLRAAEYKPGQGTWFECRLEYSRLRNAYSASTETFNADYPFGYDFHVPSTAYDEELTMYPRTPEHTPTWMTVIGRNKNASGGGAPTPG